jgi:hypothetical protein
MKFVDYCLLPIFFSWMAEESWRSLAAVVVFRMFPVSRLGVRQQWQWSGVGMSVRSYLVLFILHEVSLTSQLWKKIARMFMNVFFNSLSIEYE